MEQFGKVVRELRIWLESFSYINMLLPFSLYILFGGLGLSLVYELLILLKLYTSIFSLFGTLGHIGFLLGFWLCLISSNIKYTPYALFIKAGLYLFPFININIASVLYAALDGYLGYWLLKYTALSKEYENL